MVIGVTSMSLSYCSTILLTISIIQAIMVGLRTAIMGSTDMVGGIYTRVVDTPFAPPYILLEK